MTDEQYIVNVPSMLNRIEDLATPEEIEANKSKFRYIKTIDTHCTTITTRMDRGPNPGVIKLPDGRYRYLTERKAGRLMGCGDEDFEKVAVQFPSSPGKRNSRLYKIAGNSIAVTILEAMLELLQSGNYATDYSSDVKGQLQLIC